MTVFLVVSMPANNIAVETLRFDDFSDLERSSGIVPAEALSRRVGNSLVKLELRLNSRARSCIEVGMLDLGGVAISWHTSNGISMTRDARHLTDAADDLTMTFPTLGSFEACQDGQISRVDVGSAVVLKANRPSKLELGARCEFIGVRFSHGLWSERLRAWAAAGTALDSPQRIDTCQPVFVLLRSYLFGLRTVRQALSKGEADLARGQIGELLTEALLHNDQRVQSGPKLDPAIMRQAALDLMTRHHEDASLSIADVAGWMGTSVCAVDASFRRDGTSFEDELLRIRIGQIGRSLRDPSQSQGKLPQLALRHGIDDLNDLIAGFEVFFGTDPESYRRLLPG